MMNLCLPGNANHLVQHQRMNSHMPFQAMLNQQVLRLEEVPGKSLHVSLVVNLTWNLVMILPSTLQPSLPVPSGE